jgi:hypothetical protein
MAKKTAKLYKKSDGFSLELLGNNTCKEIITLPLKGFDGIDVNYCINDSENCIQSLYFDSSWDKERLMLFMRRYGTQVLNFKAEIIPERLQIVDVDCNIESLGKSFKMPYEFEFIALKEGKFNGVIYTKEELKKGCQTLKGKDITIDHSKSVEGIVGEVTDVFWNEKDERIEGKGIIKDEKIAHMVHDGRIKGVSVEVFVDYKKTPEGLQGTDYDFVAISLVSRPACPTPLCGIKQNIGVLS